MGAVLLCAENADSASIANWRDLGVSCVADRAGVESAVRELLSVRGMRIPMTLSDWCDRRVEPGTAAWTALAAVPGLAHPCRVSEWHEACGWTRRQLGEVCRFDLDAKPLEALWWWLASQVRALRADGQTLAQVASRLGFSDAAALHHAWIRRGLGPPPGRRRLEGGAPQGPAEDA